MTRARRITVALAIVAAALGAAGSWSLLATAHPVGAGAPRPAAAAAGSAMPTPPPFERFAETEQRPLFAASRRPAPPSAAVPIAEARASYRLEGVVIVGKQRHAILSDGGRTFRVAENDGVGDWTVKRIEPNCVLLASGPRELSVCTRRGQSDAKAR
jgi:hypothetical protein